MRWLKDPTGRFPQRPYYDLDELDSESERLVTDFLRQRYGRSAFPLTTDELTVMIEQDTSDLDLYADLTSEGEDVEGVTLFFPARKPVVQISRDLAVEETRARRLRTTLTHEYAHVRFHGFLWQFGQLPLPLQQDGDRSARCRRTGVLNATRTNWLEWQAGYVSGALLMPISPLKGLVHASLREWGVYGGVATESPQGAELIRRVTAEFDVSHDAARVRLTQRGFLSGDQSGPPLLDGA